MTQVGTVSEKVAFANEMIEREKKLLRRRLVANINGSRRPAISRDDGGITGGIPQRAAAAVGLSTSQLHRARTVVAAAHADPSLQPIVDAMDRGAITIATAHRKLTEEPAPGVMHRPPGALKMSTSTAANRLTKVIHGLQGYASALPGMDLRGEDVEHLLDEIDRQSLAIRRAVKRLKGRNTE